MTVTMSRGIGQFARQGQRHPRVVDLLVALSWIGICLPALLAGSWSPVIPTFVPVVVALVVAASLFAFRRRRPTVAFAVSFVATLPLVVTDPGLASLACGYAVFAVAVYDSARRAWKCAALSAAVTISAAMLTLFLPIAERSLGDGIGAAVAYATFGVMTLLVALLWGQNSGSRKRYIDGLVEHARHLEREHDQQVQLAALAERSRIARDIHDIVAHSLSVIVRLADGASAVLEHEPRRARDAIDQVGGVARSSLGEMRRVMSVLESTPQSESFQAGAGFEDLAPLIEVYRGIGLPVTLTLRGRPAPQPGVQMTVFRVIQEALTNALRHTSTPSVVTVLVETNDDVTVTVRNDGRTHDEPPTEYVGRGLVGMRERAALYGGTVTAGPDGDGSWAVRLVLPGAGR